MRRILSSQLAHCLDEQVLLRGWLNNLRAFGKLNFLILRDRGGLVQVVIESKEELTKIAHLHPGSVLKIVGKAVATSQAGLGIEIIHPSIEVESAVLEPPPIEYYKPEMQADLDYILDNRSVALRNKQLQTVFRIQADIAHAYRLYMHDVIQAVEYFSPNMIGSSSEGGAEFFNVDYFGYPVTLAQSSQLYKQIMVGVNERVFALAPFFRAEPSMTSRHVSEGKQLEFEMGFFDHWHQVLDIQEGCIKFIVSYLNERYPKEIPILAPEEVPFPRLTFFQAQELYYKRTGIDERDEPDLSPAAERDLCRYAAEEHGTDFIFITDWKTSKRPFYAFPNEQNPEITNTFDLLCAGTEITSGGQRRHTHQSMVEGILAKEMDPASFDDYLSIFKCGMPPHGGFGMGLERLTMTLLKLKNIREASLFPSDPKRIAGTRLKAKIVFGGENLRNEILHLLRAKEIPFHHAAHEETPTSEDSARVRGTRLEEGIKAIILRGKNSKKNYQINIPSHLKIDMKAVAERVGEKCEFEAPEVIQERYGLQVGGIPPFGPLLNIETFFDEGIVSVERSAFNCGLRTESIVMSSKDLISVVQPELGRFSKTDEIPLQ